MTQTVSFKDRIKQAFSVFAWDLKFSTSSLIVFSIIAGVFTTIIFTLTLAIYFISVQNNDSFSPDGLKMAISIFMLLSTYFVYFLTVIFTIIYTITNFSYLHNKRKADLYGPLPISRTELFLSKLFSSFVFSLVPALFFMGIIDIIGLLFGQSVPAEIGSLYLNVVLGTLASISAYGLVSICCGTTLHSVIMFIVVCFVYPLSAMFIKGIVGGFFVGYHSTLLDNSFIMNALNPLAAYDGRNVIYWLIFSAVCIVASSFLIKKRKSERAQSPFAFYLPCHIIKVLVSFLTGMFLGTLFGSLNVLGYGYLGFVFGFILASVPTFVIAHLVFYTNFSKLLRTSVSLGCLIVAVIGIIGLCNYDIFGYNSFVPKKEDVASAGFVSSGSIYNNSGKDFYKFVKDSGTDFSDEETINNIVDVHSDYVDEIGLDSSAKFQRVWISMFTSNLPFDVFGEDAYGINYKLKNGSSVVRTYLNSDFSIGPNGGAYMDDSIASEIIKKPEYIKKYGLINQVDPDNIVSMSVRSNDEKLANVDELSINQTVFKAFKKDFEANPDLQGNVLDANNTYNSIDDSELFSNTPVIVILKFQAQQKLIANPEKYGIFAGIMSTINPFNNYQEIYIIPPEYTNTLRALKEAGIINDDNQVTEASRYYDEYSASYDIY